VVNVALSLRESDGFVKRARTLIRHPLHLMGQPSSAACAGSASAGRSLGVRAVGMVAIWRIFSRGFRDTRSAQRVAGISVSSPQTRRCSPH